MQKQGDSYSDVEAGFGDPKQKDPKEAHPSLAHDKGTSPRQRRKPRRNPQAKDYQKSDFSKKEPVPQGALKPDASAGGAAGGAAGGGFQGNPGAWRDTGSSGASQSTPPKPPTPPKYSAFTNPGGAGGVKTTPGVGFDEGPGVGQRIGGAARGAAGLGARGAVGAGKLGGRGIAGIGRRVGGAISDVGQAAKVGVQQGIRSGREGAYEHGAEADARRAEQRGKVYKNPLTASAGWAARTAAKAPGVRGAAKALGFGRTKAQEEAMRTRMEYAGDDEMMLSDILNELESYVAEQSNTDVAERQLTKGNFSKMMRNTEDKAPKDWKYHV